MPINVQQNIGVDLLIEKQVSVKDVPEILIYNAGGGALFPSLALDNVLEKGIYHGGNTMIKSGNSTKSCNSLSITNEKKTTLSPEISKGLFDIEYPSSGNVAAKAVYLWNDVYTTPLGIYSVKDPNGSVATDIAGYQMRLDLENLAIQTNDVNVIPRAGDYIVFNEVPSGFTQYTNGNLNQRLQVFRGMELFQAQILDVVLIAGSGVNAQYSIRLDKSFVLQTTSTYGVVLLNRMNTSIQKELFYQTFEQVEINRTQLLGDPYNNTTNTNKPQGRKNYLYYAGHEALGMRNLLKNIINDKDTPFIVFDANNDIKDRFSTNPNTYDTDGRPMDTHFEFHLPGVMINENVFSPGQANASPFDSNYNPIENIFVASPNILSEDTGIGRYSGLYLKSDTSFSSTRYGYLLHDLRIVVIDHAELAMALSYNSNRNYTLPRPVFKASAGNSLPNQTVGDNINIVNVTSDSPIVVTTNIPHGLKRGAKIIVSGVQNTTGNSPANGQWIVDVLPSLITGRASDRLALYYTLPVTDANGRPSGGNPAVGGGIFVNNGVGNSGKILQAQPDYNFFFTYKVRDVHHNATLPFAEITNFNFTTGGEIDNQNGSLFITIPQMYFARGINGNKTNYGYLLKKDSADDLGIDVILGQYQTNPADPISPNKIIGFSNLRCIPLQTLANPPAGSVDTGVSIVVTKADFDNSTTSYDILNVEPLYRYSSSTLSQTFLVGNGKWTLGDITFRNQVEVTRTYFNIYVPADKWNDSTNPSYDPANNPFIREKYVSEVAIIAASDTTDKPMIYTKICPAVKKSNNLDINLRISVDF